MYVFIAFKTSYNYFVLSQPTVFLFNLYLFIHLFNKSTTEF